MLREHLAGQGVQVELDSKLADVTQNAEGVTALGKHLHTYTIVRPGTTTIASDHVLVDLDGSAHRFYGINEDALILVRPDGYIGLTGGRIDQDQMTSLVGDDRAREESCDRNRLASAPIVVGPALHRTSNADCQALALIVEVFRVPTRPSSRDRLANTVDENPAFYIPPACPHSQSGCHR